MCKMTQKHSTFDVLNCKTERDIVRVYIFIASFCGCSGTTYLLAKVNNVDNIQDILLFAIKIINYILHSAAGDTYQLNKVTLFKLNNPVLHNIIYSMHK